MARIVTITKFPPLEGGVSARAYWLAKALGVRGHAVHVVTDRMGIDPLYSTGGTEFEPQLRNVTVHRTAECPWIVPSVEHTLPALIDKALAVVRAHQPDVLEGSYLVPYGLAAWIVSCTANVPLVIRHAGSDMEKFVAAGVWPEVWPRLFGHADLVVSGLLGEFRLAGVARRIRTLPPYVPDPDEFAPAGREERKRPVVALVGKANYYWRHKSWDKVVDIWARLEDMCDFVIVAQGRGLQDFRDWAERKLGGGVSWREFVAPWQMPELFRSIDAVFCFQGDLPFSAFSNIAVEALYSGTAVVTDSRDLLGLYERHGLTVGQFTDFVTTVDAGDPGGAAKRVASRLESRGVQLRPASRDDYLSYVASYEECLASVIGAA